MSTDRPPPPPGLVPHLPLTSGAEHSLPPIPPGYTHSRGFTLSPRFLAWIPSVALTLIFILSFFTWVGVFPGGHQVYGQGAWRALTGEPTRDIQLEIKTLTELPPPPVKDRVKNDALLMFPYLLTLFLATVLAWMERISVSLGQNELPVAFHRIVTIWKYRIPVIAGLSTAALIFLVVQMMSGFGLERAMKKAVDDKFVESREKAGNSQSDHAKVDFFEEEELSKYNLERTTWFDLVILLHILVLLTMIVRTVLERRGNKPPPRFVIQY